MITDGLTLDEFIERARGSRFPIRAYIDEPGFSALYVRGMLRAVEGKVVRDILTIAVADAEVPGAGAFSALVKRLLEQGISVYVECVNNDRLAKKLAREGFKLQHYNDYYKLVNA